MSKPSAVYVTYIATTPEKLWQALVDPTLTRRYWAHDNVSDWTPGSRWEHRRPDASAKVDMFGEVVESVPPKRLVLTMALPGDSGDASRATFEIEPQQNGIVRLTVSHEEIQPPLEKGFAAGWAKVLSSLKTLLETGQALPVWEPAPKTAAR